MIDSWGYGWRRYRPYSPGEVALSGFLVAVLIVVWAVVLVPMWAHRSNVPAEPEVFPRARVISRRPLHHTRAGQHTARLLGSRGGPQSRASALRRRRVVLGALTGVLIVTTLAVLLGLPAPLLLGAALPFAGYLWWLRHTTAEEVARRRARLKLAAAAGRPGFRDFSTAGVGPAAIEEGTPAADEPGPLLAGPPASSAMQSPATEAARGVPASGSSGDTGPSTGPSTAPWLPVSLPLPSYVTAAPAPAVIDGDWHEEALLEGELPGEASAYALGEDVLRRRAVGD